jgi:hypothetical protein
MGHKKIQMTMRYAHRAPAHKLDAVEKPSSFNVMERKRQKTDDAVILTPAVPEEPTDADGSSAEEADSRNIQ